MKTVKNIALTKYEGKQNKLNLGLVATGTFFSTLMMVSSVVQATDLQIYLAPTAGKKTIVMMLDTSGSMGSIDSDAKNNYYPQATKDGFNSIYKDYNIGQTCRTDDKNNNIASETTPSYVRKFCTVNYSQTSTSDYQKLKNECEILPSNGGLRCYDRLTRLKDGMFAFFNSTDPSLTEVKVGLGNYSAGGDGKSGQILVPAEKLGTVDSDQRKKLKNAIKDLAANNGTPTAHAYTEAAAYLMGTNTRTTSLVKDLYKKRTTYKDGSLISYSCSVSGFTTKKNNDGSCYANTTCTSNNNTCKRDSSNKIYEKIVDTVTYYECIGWNNTDSQYCANNNTNREGISTSYWKSSGVNPLYLNELEYYQQESLGNADVIYRRNLDSGFFVSASDTKDGLGNYQSPLPAEKDRQSCDGQGVYVLSDGAANSTGETRSSALMTTALDTKGVSFNCKNGLTGGGSDSGWSCIGEFAKRLYDKAKNPANVSIQTAFVGFGNEMNKLANDYVANACKLSSRTQADRTSDDACSPGKETYGINAPGYGNGGFFIAKDSSGITKSVIQFIDNIGKNPIDPLSTGAISIPVDTLSPNTFQPYGYLRAMEPKPGTQNIIWMGNLKKYSVNNGALKSKDDNKWVFDTDGSFTKGTQDFWNTTVKTDDAGIDVGGVISNLKLPTTASSNNYRPLFTDIGSKKGEKLFKVSGLATTPKDLLNNFKTDNTLKNLALDTQLKLLNYFGYDLNLSTTLALPSQLDAPTVPFNAMGASIHSLPVQMTYSGELDTNGELKTAREQSVLYGSMEGALRTVDASSGAEQMVFVPSEILNDPVASKALRKSESDLNGVTAGIGGSWIVDSDYKVKSVSDDKTSVIASKMNVYGGMRMGGKSYYGLDMLVPTAPKFLFKITGGTGSYTRMGQTWSKPVLANIRYNNKITRVLIVGGGYDACYENPRFVLGAANPEEFKIKDSAGVVIDDCKKNQADGNAVYIVNADTGERIWSVSGDSTAGVADIVNSNMKHSIVSRIATLDRDGDGLVDNLYFGDLGGQVFRADLDNATGATLGKRVVRLADLSTGTDVNNRTISAGDQPRFYQPPTLTVHDEGKNTFLLVGIASGDRSTPLDVAPKDGREKIKPFEMLTDRPTNKVYGLIDRDVASKYLYTGQKDSTGAFKEFSTSEEITLVKLAPNPQTLAGVISSHFSVSGHQGWYRSLSSGPDGKEILTAEISNIDGITVTTTRTPGGLKAFEEEPTAITGRLMVPVYDPQGTGIVDRSNPCQPRVVGETHVQQFCLPYGACLTPTGGVDKTKDAVTGFQMLNGRNQNVLGAGIRGLSMGPAADGTNPKGANCGALTILGLQSGKGRWECNKILNPTRWYEKYVEVKNK